MDPVKTKTNLVKSFMKAGVFPFNPNSIDRSRILKTNTHTTTSSNISITMSSGHLTGSGIGASSSSVVNSYDQTMSNQTLLSNDNSSKSSDSGFVSYRDAISTLDRVLAETMSSDGNDDEDDDEDFVPDGHYVPSSIEILPSTKDRFRTKQPIITIDLPRDTSSRHNRKRKKGSTGIIGFDTSDEDGISNSSMSNFIKTHLPSR